LNDSFPIILDCLPTVVTAIQYTRLAHELTMS